MMAEELQLLADSGSEETEAETSRVGGVSVTA